MTPRSTLPGNRLAIGIALVLALAAGSAGCIGKAKPKNDNDNSASENSGGSTGNADGSDDHVNGDASSALARYRQSFEDATRDSVPQDCDKPPEKTVAGKSVGVLYEEVRKVWDDIKLVTDDGKLYLYKVTFQTDLGDIEIELHPEWAPNHVRSFLALCKVGYYDHLNFDRRIQQISKDDQIPTLSMIEAGCPLGPRTEDYDRHHGSIGYWLKDEFDNRITHEVGTIGAWHSREPDSAGCRFYICLSKGPTLDGHFSVYGKVTSGIEVARKLFNVPHRITDEDEDGCHPFDPAPVIRKVIVQPPLVDKPVPVAMMDKGN